jgi:rod shape-determining protein MreC
VFARLGQRRTTLILLVLASLTLITFDLRGNAVIDAARGTAADAFTPVQRVARSVFRPFENAWHGAFSYDKVRRQRDALQDQVDAQQGAALAAEAQVRDNQELRALVDLPTPAGITPVIAQVSSQPSSNFDLTVEINQGSDKGIRVGMPVVNGAGLIGRISSVSAQRATVRLLSDPNFSMAVKITAGTDSTPTTTTVAGSPPASGAGGAAVPPAVPAAPATTAARRGATTTAPAPTTTVPATTTALGELERGIVEGQGPGQELHVDDIGVNSGVKAGDVVSTSGVRQSLAPPDLPVGKITDVKRRPGSLFLDVRVKPAADLDRLNYVKVLLYCSDCG